jgi:hypothetical protein
VDPQRAYSEFTKGAIRNVLTFAIIGAIFKKVGKFFGSDEEAAASAEASAAEKAAADAEPKAAVEAVAPKSGIPRAKVLGVPESSETVTLWKAPGKGRTGVADEVTSGFDPAKYPGDGAYLASDKAIAEGFQKSYGNGLQEINIPRSTFDELVHKGVIKVDGYYEAGRSWHVPADKLAEFNAAIKQSTTNKFHP